jgi:hypothetical protein
LSIVDKTAIRTFNRDAGALKRRHDVGLPE